MTWELPGNYSPAGGSGLVGFDAPNGTRVGLPGGENGAFVQARWQFRVQNESGVLWQTTVGAVATGGAGRTNIPEDPWPWLRAGAYQFRWEAEGAIERLAIWVDVEACEQGEELTARVDGDGAAGSPVALNRVP